MVKIISATTLSDGYTRVVCAIGETQMEIKLSEAEGQRILAFIAPMIEAQFTSIKSEMTEVSLPLLSHIPEAELDDGVPF